MIVCHGRGCWAEAGLGQAVVNRSYAEVMAKLGLTPRPYEAQRRYWFY